jgi:hypothetical protein
MSENHPIKECRVQDFPLSIVTIEWNDGRQQTIAAPVYRLLDLRRFRYGVGRVT